MPNNTEERRDSFRVDMNAIVQLKPITADVVNGAECFPELNTYSMISEAVKLDAEIALLSDRIKDLAVQKTLKLLQKKIDLALKAQEIEKIQQFELKTQTINIGEGGCSLVSDLSVAVGDRVALALIQSSHYFTFFPTARIVELTQLENLTQIHLTFESLTEAENTTLMQHLFKIQTAQARQT